MAIVHSVGLPENASERKAIGYFAEHLYGDEYVIFHNLEISGKSIPYEYDMIVIGERAIYPIEIKGYHGVIRGNATEWEMGLGTISKSPIPLADKKARILAERLRNDSPSLKSVLVAPPLIVLTDDHAHIALNDPEKWRVMHLAEAVEYILHARGDLITDYTDRIRNALFRQFQPLKRTTQIGEYDILETIGHNNLFTTLLAKHRLLQIPPRFTLKVYTFDLYASDDVQARQREWILRDGNALARLEGQRNIVRAFPPFPWESNQIVLPLEWVDGYSLRGVLDSSTALTYERKLDIASQVCHGLKYAHTHGVIHRDLRPENIIIPHAGPVKLVNFDCARVEGSIIRTIASQVRVHLDERYVAPEVWLSAANASRVSDVYAVGILFFELLTGQLPYSKIRQVFEVRGLPVLPSQILHSPSKDLDDLIASMCAFDPVKRTTTLEDAIEYLELLN